MHCEGTAMRGEGTVMPGATLLIALLALNVSQHLSPLHARHAAQTLVLPAGATRVCHLIHTTCSHGAQHLSLPLTSLFLPPLTSLLLPRTHWPLRLCMHTASCGTRHLVVACGGQGTRCDDCQNCCCSLEPRANRQGRVRRRYRPRAGVRFAQGRPSSLVLLLAPLPPPSTVLGRARWRARC
jgi:hypothetical protein